MITTPQERRFQRRRFGTFTIAAGPWWTGGKTFAEEARGISVVIDTEHQLACGYVDARSPTDHLVEADGTLKILEENNVSYAGHIYSGGQ